MIFYSLSKKPVNSNFIEINQAITNVKAAEAAGEGPDPADLKLINSMIFKYYPTAQYNELMDLNELARHMENHHSPFDRFTIQSVVNASIKCMIEMLTEGKKVQFGELGKFSIRIVSTGVDDPKDFSTDHITDAKIVWEKGDSMDSILKDAKFIEVPTREVQKAAKKAIRLGEKLVLSNSNASDSGSSTTTPAGTNTGSSSQQTGNTTPPASSDIVITAQAQPAAGGTVSGGGSYASGASVTLTAVPNSGYKFLRWNDGDTNAVKTVTVTESKTYNAIFSTI